MRGLGRKQRRALISTCLIALNPKGAWPQDTDWRSVPIPTRHIYLAYWATTHLGFLGTRRQGRNENSGTFHFQEGNDRIELMLNPFLVWFECRAKPDRHWLYHPSFVFRRVAVLSQVELSRLLLKFRDKLCKINIIVFVPPHLFMIRTRLMRQPHSPALLDCPFKMRIILISHVVPSLMGARGWVFRSSLGTSSSNLPKSLLQVFSRSRNLLY